MKTFYTTTKPGWFDTAQIAKAKLLQQLKTPSTASGGLVASPDTLLSSNMDTKLRTLQKMLKKLQG